MILNTGYEAIVSGLFASSLAQVIKFFANYIKFKKFDADKLFTTGGMPSSHSSGVVALTTSVGLISGFGSVLFAVSAGYALVVMHDAAGLRQDSGQMAKCLNQIMQDLRKSNIKTISKQLKELLGHTFAEVAAGAFLGVLFALLLHLFLLRV